MESDLYWPTTPEHGVYWISEAACRDRRQKGTSIQNCLFQTVRCTHGRKGVGKGIIMVYIGGLGMEASMQCLQCLLSRVVCSDKAILSLQTALPSLSGRGSQWVTDTCRGGEGRKATCRVGTWSLVRVWKNLLHVYSDPHQLLREKEGELHQLLPSVPPSFCKFGSHFSVAPACPVHRANCQVLQARAVSCPSV